MDKTDWITKENPYVKGQTDADTLCWQGYELGKRDEARHIHKLLAKWAVIHPLYSDKTVLIPFEIWNDFEKSVGNG